MNNGRKEYTFFWFIENYSYCWHKNGDKLSSPNFTIDQLQGSTWTLSLYPRGTNENYKGHMSLFLRRYEDGGPENISIKYQLSVLAEDLSAIHSAEHSYTFGKGNTLVWSKFLQIDEILLKEKSGNSSQDILRLCCKIWKGKGDIRNIGQSSARTRIKVEKIPFLHAVESFSSLQKVKQTVKVASQPEEQSFISSSIYFSEGSSSEDGIRIEIVPSDTDKILWKCELSLLDGSGNAIEARKADNRNDAEGECIRALSLPLTRKEILNRKCEFLSDDKLLVHCECTFSAGIEFEAIEETVNEMPLAI